MKQMPYLGKWFAEGKMPRKPFGGAGVLLVLTFSFHSQRACFAIPQLIQYQGKATDKAGLPISGTPAITFRLYDAVTAGSKEWEETHTAVSIQNGLFSVRLGGVTPLNLTFDKPHWLSVEIDSDGELIPRHELTSVPYAYMARHAAQASLASNAVLATTANVALSPAIPSGVIVMWSGSIAAIPEGWTLCDGTAGTPDLRNRFVFGAGGKAGPGNLGPSGDDSNVDPVIYGSGNDIYMKTSESGSNPKQDGGGTCTARNVRLNYFPPYFALAYIMKL